MEEPVKLNWINEEEQELGRKFLHRVIRSSWSNEEGDHTTITRIAKNWPPAGTNDRKMVDYWIERRFVKFRSQLYYKWALILQKESLIDIKVTESPNPSKYKIIPLVEDASRQGLVGKTPRLTDTPDVKSENQTNLPSNEIGKNTTTKKTRRRKESKKRSHSLLDEEGEVESVPKRQKKEEVVLALIADEKQLEKISSEKSASILPEEKPREIAPLMSEEKQREKTLTQISSEKKSRTESRKPSLDNIVTPIPSEKNTKNITQTSSVKKKHKNVYLRQFAEFSEIIMNGVRDFDVIFQDACSQSNQNLATVLAVTEEIKRMDNELKQDTQTILLLKNQITSLKLQIGR